MFLLGFVLHDLVSGSALTVLAFELGVASNTFNLNLKQARARLYVKDSTAHRFMEDIVKAVMAKGDLQMAMCDGRTRGDGARAETTKEPTVSTV